MAIEEEKEKEASMKIKEREEKKVSMETKEKEKDPLNLNREKLTSMSVPQITIVHNDDSDAWNSDDDSYLLRLHEDVPESTRYDAGDYFCCNCQIQFATWNLLSRHTRLHHKTINCFKCLLCSETYYKLVGFESHVMKEHNIDAERIEECLERVTFYRAANGTSYGTTYRQIRNEQKPKVVVTPSENKAKVLSCNDCDYKSRCRRSLATHVAKHLDDVKCSCYMCGRTYETRRNLTYHIRFAHPEVTCICDFCGKSFRTTKGLHKHRKFVHYGGKHECEICHRGLASEKNLRDHMVNCHVDKQPLKKRNIEQNIVCDACGKTFSRPDALRNHMRVHTGEKPYACPICKGSFRKKNSLKQHLILHTGAKPYVCDICGKKFSQKPGLTGHRKSHPGSNPPLPPTFISPIIDDLLKQCEL